MDEALVTISDATAHHVLGHSSVTLGAGDLNLFPASAGSKHDLMLTVGSAGFSLHHDTMFGTLEGDPRAYVFSPEIEGVKGGFVKITLPEGVEKDGSPLSALQTKFEQVLVAHGLLQPGGNDAAKEEGAGEHRAAQQVKNAIALGTDESLVNIPQCIAAQVLGDGQIAILSEGILSLVVMPKSEKEEEEPVLTLTVGKSAFPLYKDTLFGTIANDPRTYVFRPASQEASESFVAIVLPEADSPNDASSEFPSLQNKLELVLVEYGLLKDGLRAAADEVARSIREDGTHTAQRIRDIRLRPVSAGLSNIASNVSQGAESGVHSLADIAHGVSEAVLGAALVAGAVVTHALAPCEAEAESTGRRPDASMQWAAGEAQDASTDAGCKTAENDQEKETQSVEGKAGLDVAAPSSADVATETGEDSSFAPSVVRTPSAEQNEELALSAEEVGDDLDSDQGRHVQDEDWVDTELLYWP